MSAIVPPAKPLRPDLQKGVSVPALRPGSGVKPPRPDKPVRPAGPATAQVPSATRLAASHSQPSTAQPPAATTVAPAAAATPSMSGERGAGFERVRSAAVLPTQSRFQGSSEALEKTLGEALLQIRECIRRRSWRNVQKTAERYRKESEALPHVHLQFRLALVLSLVKFRLYRNAQEDIDALGDLDDPRYLYQSFPKLYPGLTGSFMPFSLRVIKAELPSFLNLAFHSIDLLFALVDRCRKERQALPTSDDNDAPLLSGDEDDGLWMPRPAIGSDGVDGYCFALRPTASQPSSRLLLQRENRLLFSIATRFCMDKEYPSALDILRSEIAPQYRRDPHLQSAIARIALQMGDVRQAAAAVAVAAEEVRTRGLQAQPAFDALLHTNDALLAVANNDFAAAIAHFQAVLAIDPDNYNAANNVAICYLFDKKLPKAIATYESAIQTNPLRFLIEPIVLNLCTLYDLESDNSTHQKRAMWKTVSKHADDAFDFSVLKLKLS